MAVERPPGPENDYTIACTMPDQLLRHNISDEELDMLCEGRRDNVWEGMWVAIGLLVGSLPSAANALWKYDPKSPTLALVDLIQIVIFFISLVMAGVLCSIVVRRGRAVTKKEAEIRARTQRIHQGQAGADAGTE
jgi:hypothetical protein